ncbi:replicative DNA helicase [Clostridium sp.]|uniref:replicative DNA helicase n=1 Tax=Clostridium sp. TaxID=1506 RepID=UPI0026069C2C|nr:replicative DNA helicase [Clostridium sp.]
MDIINKSVPQSIETEMCLLGCIISDKENLEKVSWILDKEDFYLEKHKRVYQAIKDLEAKDVNIDLVTLSNYIHTKNIATECGGISYLTDLTTSSLYSNNVYEYVNIIKDKSNRRNLINAGKKIIDSSYGDSEFGEIISGVEDSLYKLTSKSKKDEPVEISEAVNNALINLEQNYKNGGKLQGKTTGFRDIDNVTSGLKKGEFMIVAARPSMGKTAFALNLGQCASKEANVAIFSLEMSEIQLMNRLIASRSLVDLGSVQNGKLNEEQFEKIAMAANDLANRNIFIDDKSMSISEIESKCKKLKRKKGLDVVIIDYLQLIESNEKNVQREQEVSKISRKLKKLAKQLDITVIALSQLSRAPEQRADHRPMLSDLRESGAIEQDADIIIFLYRDEYYNKESEDKHIAEVIFGKNRNGEVKTIKLGWAGQYQRFTSLDWR